MDKENVYTYSGIIFHLKNEGNTRAAITWMNCEDVLSEKNQSHKDKYFMFPFI